MQFQGFDWLSGHGTVYMSHYTMLTKKRPLNCFLPVLAKRNQHDVLTFLDCF